jgi:hypothetical protein
LLAHPGFIDGGFGGGDGAGSFAAEGIRDLPAPIRYLLRCRDSLRFPDVFGFAGFGGSDSASHVPQLLAVRPISRANHIARFDRIASFTNTSATSPPVTKLRLTDCAGCNLPSALIAERPSQAQSSRAPAGGSGFRCSSPEQHAQAKQDSQKRFLHGARSVLSCTGKVFQRFAQFEIVFLPPPNNRPTVGL